MKQEIICSDCNERYPLIFNEGPMNKDAHIKNIQGISVKDTHCDFCCDRIKTGDICHAVSKWWSYGGGRSYYPWEHDHIIQDMELIPTDNEGASDDDFNALMGLIKTQFKRDESI